MCAKIKKKNSNRKAITPFVAVVILVVVTVGLAIFIGSWLRSYALSQTEETETSTTSIIYCSSKLIKVNDVFWDGSQLVVRVENPGAEPIKVRRITAYNSSYATCLVYYSNTGVEFGSNEVRDFKASCPDGFGNVYKVRVSTECANVFDEWVNESAVK